MTIAPAVSQESSRKIRPVSRILLMDLAVSRATDGSVSQAISLSSSQAVGQSGVTTIMSSSPDIVQSLDVTIIGIQSRHSSIT